jgi:SAM-dependent methyltransferase
LARDHELATLQEDFVTRQGKRRSATHENLIDFWESEANELGETPQVTIRDHYFRIHELHALLAFIPACSRLLDVGCGSGFGTLFMSARAEHTLGIDFARAMISWADRLRDDADYRAGILEQFSPLFGWSGRPGASLDFEQGDILHLVPRQEPFDVITGQRILINLPTDEEQLAALRGLRSLARPGSWLILTEATTQGHRRTDEYRASFGIPPLEKYWHNHYVDEGLFSDGWSAAGWNVVNTLGFDTYTLLSKVVYPASHGPDNCSFLSAANAAAMEVASSFRTSRAVAELGMPAFLDFYVDRVAQYDPPMADVVAKWTAQHGSQLVDWDGLGHQRLIIARASAD